MPDDIWPDFTNEQLPDGRVWSGAFDSFDQYRNLAYWKVTLDGKPPFMAMIDAGWTDDITDWKSSQLRDGCLQRLAEVVAAGHTNTDYWR